MMEQIGHKLVVHLTTCDVSATRPIFFSCGPQLTLLLIVYVSATQHFSYGPQLTLLLIVFHKNKRPPQSIEPGTWWYIGRSSTTTLRGLSCCRYAVFLFITLLINNGPLPASMRSWAEYPWSRQDVESRPQFWSRLDVESRPELCIINFLESLETFLTA
jgi:hypothetical protein